LIIGDYTIVPLYLCGMFFGYFYSLSPIRFKNRGILGLFSYSIATTVIYSLLPGTLFNVNFPLLLCLSCSLFLDKWVNLHFHQVKDFNNDRRTGLKTYVAARGIERSRITLKRIAFIASLAMLLLLLLIILMEKSRFMQYIMVIVSAAVIISIFIYVRRFFNKRPAHQDMLKELPWYYLSLTYLLFRVLPPLMFIELTALEPTFAVMFFLSLLSMVGGTFYYSRGKS
jgi:hypothetical protein